MKSTNAYLRFIEELKQNIIHSRYQAMRLANREQLVLYFKTGKLLTQKINNEKWGAKVVNQISQDLQKELPGLRGFSRRSLMKMKQFYIDYKSLLGISFSDVSCTQTNKQSIVPLSTAQLDNTLESFWSLSFSHHIMLLSKCKSIEEKLFYMAQVTRHYWSVTTLEYQIESNLFYKQGKLPNNFSATVNEKLQPSALQLFKR